MSANGEEFYKEMQPGAIENPEYDSIIAGKGGYFVGWFYWLRTIVYVGVFVVFARLFRKWSLKEDEIGGVSLHKKQYKREA